MALRTVTRIVGLFSVVAVMTALGNSYSDAGAIGATNRAVSRGATPPTGTSPAARTHVWMQVASGFDDATCALRIDQSLWCWGSNIFGQLGLGEYHDTHRPKRVGDENDWASVAMGAGDACGIKLDRSLWCWGDNSNGQLGQGYQGGSGSSVPIQVGQDTDWQSISLGSWFACGLKTDGTLWCWGRNFDGDLGFPGGNVAVPTQVGVDADWKMVSAGWVFTCATKLDHTLWCWGYNDQGQLGTGDVTNRDTPTQVGSETDWAIASAGDGNACATKADRTAWCWGDGSQGELGDGGNVDSLVPVEIDGGDVWSMVKANAGYACGTQLDHTLWCWGDNTYGQLGVGDTTNRNVPTQVGDQARWMRAATIDEHTCSLWRNHTLWCWGSPKYGDLGVGNRTRDTTVPIQVGLPNHEIPSRPTLTAVSALSPTDAWAVGFSRQRRRTNTLTEHWDGTSWTVVPCPNPGGHHLNKLTSVDAISATDVWAVGYYNTSGDHYDRDKTMALHWDGQSWSSVATPDGDVFYNNFLTAVSGSGPNDVWAVGYYYYDEELGPVSLVEHWNGTSWVRVNGYQPRDEGDYLYAVVAISTTDAWAAGTYSLNEHWNGSKWQGGDSLANTYGMSASSSNDVWAVGDAATYHFDGTRWTEKDPTISSLSSVSTTSPSSALAVGASHAVRWNGQRWKVVGGPDIGTLNGVNLDSATDGWAVGEYGRHALIEHWDGTSLTLVR